ncbi:hypothetical protein AAF712_011987 [Marasmius tenuissimus]|uniref:CxC2-like cysteine cluster KDZ transposase-associated domain-containing protein n=1 Tax=Marasmius tenuissimus TaxID=585030 RepID=A0ABR2ZIT8_9AGAR
MSSSKRKAKVVKVSNVTQRQQQFAQPPLQTGLAASWVHTLAVASGRGIQESVVVDAEDSLKRSVAPETSEKPGKGKKMKREHKSQGQSIFLSRFREEPQSSTLIQAFMDHEVEPLTGTQCCTWTSRRTIRCTDCFFSRPTCTECFLRSHTSLPLHWAEEWNGRFFERKDASAIGLIIHLGHNGEPCHLAGHSSPRTMTIAGSNGIHTAKVTFCDCPGSGTRFEQLIRAHLFPATVDKSETAFTFDLLRDFHLHTLASKKTAYDYLYGLRMKTDNAFPEDVKNPLADFNRIARLWRTLLILKRAGIWHNLWHHFPLRKPGAVSFPCFACPEPGFNAPEDWLDGEEVDDEFIHLASAFWSIDGHFGLSRRNKRQDPDDISLLEGLAMFPQDKWFSDIMRVHGKNSPEKSNCAKFKVMELQNRLKFKGCVISGVVAVQCARHGVFMSATDLSLGESYIHGDLALATAMEFVMAEALRRTKFFRRVVVIYDIACQFSINFRSRIEQYLPELGDVVDLFLWLVGKLHLDGHIPDCKYLFSLNYKQGCARTDGEGIERTWSEMKQAGGHTQEMNHGHRHDVLIDYWNHWGWSRLARLVALLRTKIPNARKMLQDKLDYFLRLSVGAGHEQVKLWEQLSTEPVRDRRTGEVQSVYRFNESLVPSQESVLHSLLQRESDREQSAEEEARGPEAIFINQGLKIESIQSEIKYSLKKSELSLEEQVAKRDHLRSLLRVWRQLQLLHMPGVRDLLAAIKVGLPEDEELYLPSFFQDGRYRDTALSRTEVELRKGQAFDAIQDLKYTLTHKMVLVRTKRKEAKGSLRNTRAAKYIRYVGRRTDSWKQKYRVARECLIRLGVTDGSADSDFPELKDEDVYRQGLEKKEAELGEGSKTAGWIWVKALFSEARSEEQERAAAEEIERVPWFRARADVHRWLEEVELLEEEFRRMIKGCEKMSEVWKLTAVESRGKGEGYGAYAYHKSDMFARMAWNGREVFESVKVGGGWPAEGQTLSDYLRSRRPRLTVDWTKIASKAKVPPAITVVPGIQCDDDEDTESSNSDESDTESKR